MDNMDLKRANDVNLEMLELKRIIDCIGTMRCSLIRKKIKFKASLPPFGMFEEEYILSPKSQRCLLEAMLVRVKVLEEALKSI